MNKLKIQQIQVNQQIYIIYNSQFAMKSSTFYPNYKTNSNILLDFIFFHNISPLIFSFNKITQSHKLTTSHLPNITYQESAHHLQNLLQTQILLHQNLHSNQLLIILFKSFKIQILKILFLAIMQVTTRLLNSIVFQYLIHAVIHQIIPQSFYYSALLFLLMLLYTCFHHNTNYYALLLNNQIRTGLIAVLHHRILKLSSSKLKYQYIGKIINLLSTDMNILQLKLTYIFQGLGYPILLIGSIVLLIQRLGISGLVCVLGPLSIFLIQYFIGNTYQNLYTNLNLSKDERIQRITETLQSIKIIKFNVLEQLSNKILGNLKQKQNSFYYLIYIWQSLERAIGASFPTFSTLFCFIVAHYYSRKELTIPIMFSILELMSYLKYYSLFCVMAISFFPELNLILKRYAQFFTIPSVKMNRITQTTKKSSIQADQNLCFQQLSAQQIQQQQIFLQNGQAQFKNFNGYRQIAEQKHHVLKNINIRIQKGKIYGLTGSTGSGKSSFLSSFIEELSFYSGIFKFKGSIAYVQQQPYIFPLTIKQNILFGKQYKQQLYIKTIKNCCLNSDFEQFQFGDETQVGQKGTTLSGGQKSRIGLARAIYSEAEIYLLDDSLCNLDCKNVIKGMLKDKTILFVCNNLCYLNKMDKILIFSGGRLRIIENLQIDLINLIGFDKRSSQTVIYKSRIQKQKQLLFYRQEDEQVNVKLSSFIEYIKLHQSLLLLYLPIIVCIFADVSNIIFLRILVNYHVLKIHSVFFILDIQIQMSSFWYILILIQFLYFITSCFKYYLINLMIIKSNHKLYSNLTSKLLTTSSSFYDQTPIGRIVSRYTNDLSTLDSNCSNVLIQIYQRISISLTSIINISIILPIYIVIAIILFLLLSLWYFYCKNCILATKQLQLRMKSPIISHFNTNIQGLNQLKIYNQLDQANNKMNYIIDQSTKASYSFLFSTRIFGIYTSYISLLIMAITLIIVLIFNQQQLLYPIIILAQINFCDIVQWMLRQIMVMQSFMVSVVRIYNLCNLPTQEELFALKSAKNVKIQKQVRNVLVSRQEQVPIIKFMDYTMKYQHCQQATLKNINFSVFAGEKIGIVGRTGAGKSSIIHGLFRLIDPVSGKIYVYNKDISQIQLYSFRKSLSIITQLPFVFKGSIKQNLDPYSKYTQQQLWNVLYQINLSKIVQSLPNQLDTQINGNSDILSIGQKKLLCLAKIILKNDSIIILDQATSNFDIQTDEFIQKILKSRFKKNTILAITHRLTNIADYDKIIVVQKGRIVEMGSPYELLVEDIKDEWITKKGYFSQMVLNLGEQAKLIYGMSRQSYYLRLG